MIGFGRGWRQVRAVAAASVRDRLRYGGDLLGTGCFLAAILFVFSHLWQAVLGAGGEAGGFSAADLVLYMLITEAVTMSPGQLHDRIAREVRSGDLAIHLLRPLSWVHWELARGLGAALVRAGVLLLAGVPVVVLLVGAPAVDVRGVLVSVALLLPAAVALEVTARVLIGLSAFWLEESQPVYWIWQKLSFVLGGLFLPLDLYPDWLRAVASVLPFQATLYGPARTAVAFDAGVALRAASALAVWLAVLLLALHVAHARASRRLQLGGG